MHTALAYVIWDYWLLESFATMVYVIINNTRDKGLHLSYTLSGCYGYITNTSYLRDYWWLESFDSMISIIIYNTRRGLHLICISCECYSYITRICSLSIHISIIKHKVTMVTVEIENSTDSTTTLIFPGNQALLTTTVSVNSHKNKLVVTRKKRRRRKW